MSAIHEVSSAVRARRKDMGLTQTGLAKLSGLSRSTINQLEQGTIQDLSLKRATAVTNALGITLGVVSISRRHLNSARSSALAQAATSANVSYKGEIAPEELRAIFLGGPVPRQFVAHVSKLLEEAPMSLLAALAAQLQEENAAAPPATWQRMRELAKTLDVYRAVWTV